MKEHDWKELGESRDSFHPRIPRRIYRCDGCGTEIECDGGWEEIVLNSKVIKQDCDEMVVDSIHRV